MGKDINRRADLRDAYYNDEYPDRHAAELRMFMSFISETGDIHGHGNPWLPDSSFHLAFDQFSPLAPVPFGCWLARKNRLPGSANGNKGVSGSVSIGPQSTTINETPLIPVERMTLTAVLQTLAK